MDPFFEKWLDGAGGAATATFTAVKSFRLKNFDDHYPLRIFSKKNGPEKYTQALNLFKILNSSDRILTMIDNANGTLLKILKKANSIQDIRIATQSIGKKICFQLGPMFH